MQAPFGPWLPDLPDYGVPHSSDVNNVLPPSTSGFKPFPAFSSITSAITERPQGAISVRGLTGTIYNFCGDIADLYKMASDGLSWTDVSRASGGVYATPVDGWWNFTPFGDYVIAVNLADATQSFQLSLSTRFAALSGSPPRGAFIGVCRDFVVIARVADYFNRIQWSGINDSVAWTPSATTMSDYNDFADSGAVMGFVGGEFGVVFLERSIQRMAFEGPPTIFRFDKIAHTMGCQIETSIAAYENLIFFKSHDGFYLLRGGAELVPIGSEKIDRFAADDINFSYKYRCSSAIDPSRKLYLFSYPNNNSVDGTPNSVLIYHWPSGEWSKASFDHSFLYTAATQASITIDGLSALSSTIDGLTYPVDSLFYAGSGNLILSGFDTTYRQGFFAGQPLEAVVTTSSRQFVPGRKAMLRGARPIIEGTSVTPTLTPIYRDRLQDAETTGTAVSVNANGYVPLRTNARYHKLKLTVPAGSSWTSTAGLDDLKISATGAR